MTMPDHVGNDPADAYPGAVPENPDDPDPYDPQDALRDAVARARRTARDKGLRPGLRPQRKRRWDQPAAAEQGRDPAVLGDQMQRMLLDRGWRVDVAAGSVLAKWPQIVGPDVAAHTEAVSFEEGVLTVRADSTAWRTQLEYMTSTILGQIEQEVGAKVVTQLRLAGPSTPSWSRGFRKVHGGRGPRDTYG